MLFAPTLRPQGVVLFLAVALPPSVLQAQSTFEEPPVLQASELVDSSLLESPNHRVEEDVENDGRMNHFVIQSDFGEFPAHSERMLQVRVGEIHALAKLTEISRTEAFAKALAQTAIEPVEAVGRVATHPVATVKGMPGGFGGAFRGLYYKGRRTAEKLSSEDDENLDNDQPEKDKSDENAPPGEGEVEAASDAPGKESTASTAAKSYLGYNSARRELAQSVGVDPYSTNEVLQKELTRLAQAAVAGGLSFKQVTPDVSVPLYVEDISDIVWHTPAYELEQRNNDALEEMGVPEKTRSEFRDHPFFTLTSQTIVTRSLGRLGSASDREVLIDFALLADSLEAAELITRTSRVLAAYNEQVRSIRELQVGGNEELGRLMFAVDESGRLIVPIAFDYLIWQAGMEQRGPLYRYEDRHIWSSGRLSPGARRELEERGWKIQEQVLPRAVSEGEKEDSLPSP